MTPHECMTYGKNASPQAAKEWLKRRVADTSWPVALELMSLGAIKVHDRQKVVMTLDDEVQNESESNLKNRQIGEFAKKQGVALHPAGRGIGLQTMIGNGHASAGSLTIALVSHSNVYGGLSRLRVLITGRHAARHLDYQNDLVTGTSCHHIQLYKNFAPNCAKICSWQCAFSPVMARLPTIRLISSNLRGR